MKLIKRATKGLLRKTSVKQNRAHTPRRARRGFSLAEMTLVLIVTAMIMQTAIELATSYTKRQITQRTAANMSRVADDVQSYMDRNYFALSADLAAAPGNVIEADWASLIAGNLISLDSPPVSPDGGDLRLFFTMRGNSIYSVLMSFDGNGSTYSPRPDPNTKFAGKVQGNASNSLRGWDFALDIPEVATLTGENLNGNIGVIRQVSYDVNVDPYLHRIAIPGRPDLNTMEADLDMGGFDMNNALTVTTDNIDVQDQMVVNGRLNADRIDTAGDVLAEDMQANQADLNEINARNATVAGNLSANSAAIQGDLTTQTITGQDASFRNLSTANFDGGTVFLASGNYIQIDAQTVNAERVIADQVFVGD
jgi:competence protein ComGC